jgi:hypothetical protein
VLQGKVVVTAKVLPVKRDQMIEGLLRQATAEEK